MNHAAPDAGETEPSNAPYTHPHLLDIDSLSDQYIHALLHRAEQLRQGATPANLAHQTIALLFYEASTRTRVSFELAATRLGAKTVVIQSAASSAIKGESLSDTMHTLAAMGVKALVLRHPQNHAAAQLAATAPAPLSIINGGDGTHAHPSQALQDVLALQQHGFEVRGKTLTIVGDIRHSRVARSTIALWRRLGAAQIRLAAPEQFLPAELPTGPVQLYLDLDQALPDSDAVMMLRIQRERISGITLPDGAQYFKQWGLTEEKLSLTPTHCRVLHPGPINRNVEIASSVADGPRSLILEQVRNGIYLRMALFEKLLADQHR